MSGHKPLLVLSEVVTESGRNDQVGLMQMFKAHTLVHDLTPEKASRYLVFASLLAARLEEAGEPR